MQKKIIALAIASALTMPALAMAAPTVYGDVRVAYELTDTGSAAAGTGTAAAKRNQVSDNFSRLGFKGSEDLGNGLTGVYQMEGRVMADIGDQTLFDENTFLGLAGSFGTVVLGNHDTPYKLSTRGLDVFEDSTADNRSLMGMTSAGISQDASLTDVVAYLSPNFDGFSFAVASVGANDNTLPVISATSEISAISISAGYARDNWTVGLGNQTITNDDSTTPANEAELTATKIAGTYAMDEFTVGLVYEMLSDSAGSPSVKAERNNIYLAGTYNVSDMGTVKLAYTQAGTLDVGGAEVKNSGATQVSLGYDHAMTENTTLFAAYTSIANDTAATYGLTAAGSTAGGQVVAADDDPSAISFGVRHAF